MSWLKLDIEVVAAHVDAVGDLLLGLGASSAAVTPAPGTSGMIVEPDPGATPLWQRCKLSALLPLDVDLAEVHAGLARYAVKVLDTGFLEDANWLERWRQHAVQECFGGRLWLQPRDADPVAGLCLRLNPGLAFGTGGHPTTRMCLQWLAAQDLGGCTLVDYGCGSGVLGLAACVLGAREVVAVDHDPQAWEG
jgi:ribosomal protein L11 methyltransferase